MTRNLYLGTNLNAIVQAKSTPEAFSAVEKGWADVQANDFPTRARAIAGEIARARPDFVGFQELSLYRTQTPAKIKIRRVRSGLYSTTTSLFGGFVIAKRGWVLADATVAGRTFRVVTTHLESFNDTSQVAQGKELVAPGGPATTSLPTILLGDLNSRADGTGTPTHADLLAAGFQDAWTQAHPGDIGLTCCHGDDLREVGGPFYSRIDYVLMRNGFRAVAAGIVGQKPGDRLGGLWPSDHAGVWARLLLP